MSLLDSLFQLLGPQLEGVELRRAWGPGWGSRLVRGPVVSGEVLSARWAGGRRSRLVWPGALASKQRVKLVWGVLSCSRYRLSSQSTIRS